MSVPWVHMASPCLHTAQNLESWTPGLLESCTPVRHCRMEAPSKLPWLPSHAAAEPAAWCSGWSPLPLGGQLGSQGLIARPQLLNLGLQGSHVRLQFFSLGLQGLLLQRQLLRTLLGCLMCLGCRGDQCNESLKVREGDGHTFLLPWCSTSRWPLPRGWEHQWQGRRVSDQLHGSWTTPATLKPSKGAQLLAPDGPSKQVSATLFCHRPLQPRWFRSGPTFGSQLDSSKL